MVNAKNLEPIMEQSSTLVLHVGATQWQQVLVFNDLLYKVLTLHIIIGWIILIFLFLPSPPLHFVFIHPFLQRRKTLFLFSSPKVTKGLDKTSKKIIKSGLNFFIICQGWNYQSRNKVAILKGAVGSPPFLGRTNVCCVFWFYVVWHLTWHEVL